MSKPKLILPLTIKEAACMEKILRFVGEFDLSSGPMKAPDGLGRRQNFNLYLSLGQKLWEATNQFNMRYPDEHPHAAVRSHGEPDHQSHNSCQ